MAALPLIMQGASALAGAMGVLSGGSKSMQLAAPGASELAGSAAVQQFLPQMGNLVNAGPGMNEVKANMSTQNDFAKMLQQYSQGGFLPGQQDFASANQFATSAFQPQQVAINQQFQDEQLKANQMAARMGRPVNDPLIQAKLSQERQRAQERLGASQSAYVSEFAQKLPQQRLGYMEQLSGLRSGLASQAMSNRQALVSLGSQIEGQGMQFRLGSAQQNQSQTTGGGLGGALSNFMGMTGALKGAGMGGGILDMFTGGGAAAASGGGGSSSSPFGLGNLNTAFGFSSDNGAASPAFGSSNLFGQLTGNTSKVLANAMGGSGGPGSDGYASVINNMSTFPKFMQGSPEQANYGPYQYQPTQSPYSNFKF